MISRIDKIKETYSQRLHLNIKENHLRFSLESLWDTIISADPSPNKKNVRWLVDTYLNNGFLWEDIASGEVSKVYETLTEFDKHKRNLEPSERSLMKYQSLGSLWKAIKPYVGHLTANEGKREERDKAYAEAEVVVERADGLKVIVPRTEYASKWFGRGTRWCTAGDNGNMFYRYMKDAPLFIILMPNGDKLQLWSFNGLIQFMDENDDKITKEYIEEHWSVLENVVETMYSTKHVPRQYQTYENCFQNLKQNICVDNFLLMPDEYRTKEVCDFILERKPFVMCFAGIPEHLRTEEFCKKAVKKNGDIVRIIPEEYQTYEMYKLAVAYKGGVLKHVPDEFKTEEICRLAVMNNGLSLYYIPEHYRACEFYEMAVRQNGLALQYVPEKNRTLELCHIAVNVTGFSVLYVPEEYITEDLYKLAIKQDSRGVMGIIPEKFQTPDFLRDVISNVPTIIACLKSKFISNELCTIAVTKDSTLIKYVPDEHNSVELCQLALEDDASNIQFISKKFMPHFSHIKGDYIEEVLHTHHKAIISDFKKHFDM